ncbi:MAG: DUF3570 domain-containing protein, partial [Deltaproteobacteria bacterium]|nr:DUF3570 domain-containing protein [Deltaproteobacteria bacterium]
ELARKPRPSPRALAAAASLAALGTLGAGTPLETTTSGEVAFYADTNAVLVVSPSVAARVGPTTGELEARGSYLVDVVSAASIDIVTTASPRWTEVRQEGTLGARATSGREELDLSLAASTEPDTLSLAGAVSAAHRGERGTLGLSYSLARDLAGRRGTPFSVVSRELFRHQLGLSAEGALDPATLLGLRLDLGLDHGDPSKPYRMLPLFDAAIAPAIRPGESLARVNELRLPARLGERLPSRRLRAAVAGRIARHLGPLVLSSSLRVEADEWERVTSTAELRILARPSRRLLVGPRLRGHAQTGVSFWRRAYVAEIDPEGAVTVPRYRTGDRELGPLTTAVVGAEAHLGLGPRRAPHDLRVGLLGDLWLTRFLDTLYLDDRRAVLAAAQFSGVF